MHFALESDGCEVDAEDIVIGAVNNAAVMLLCPGQQWTMV